MTGYRNHYFTKTKFKKRKALFLSAILLASFFASEVYADDNVCTIKAEKAVWVTVFDVDKDGNILYGYSSNYYAREILPTTDPMETTLPLVLMEKQLVCPKNLFPSF